MPFTFTGKAAGQYILSVRKHGLQSIFRGYNIETDSKLDRVYSMGKNKDSLPLDRVLEQPIEPVLKRVRVGGKVAESNILKKTTPFYPDAAKAAGSEGNVELFVVISGTGIPKEIRVDSSPNDDLAKAAVETVGQWRYKPTTMAHQPLEVATAVIISYHLTR